MAHRSYAYYANPLKTVLIVKQDKLEDARTLFQDSGINVTTDVCRYMGSSLGSEGIQEILTREVQKWVDSIKELS